MSPSPSRPEFLAQNRIPRDCVMQNNGVADSRRTHYSAHKLDILARVCIASEERKKGKENSGQSGERKLASPFPKKTGPKSNRKLGRKMHSRHSPEKQFHSYRLYSRLFGGFVPPFPKAVSSTWNSEMQFYAV